MSIYRKNLLRKGSLTTVNHEVAILNPERVPNPFLAIGWCGSKLGTLRMMT